MKPWLISILAFPVTLMAGGPRFVAGSSFFDPATKGTPITWAQGAVHYYTDQGNLSPLLPGAAADAFVADAFSRWTSVPTAMVTAVHDGQLGEDVSGLNVSASGDGSISMPLDILDAATDKPLAVVYDADGKVIDALQGTGASSLCFTNAVVEAPPVFTSDAHFSHALVILNGNCATTTDQLADMKYRLVRTLGRVLGLGWSQTKVNPTTADLPGFALMHETDPISCLPISVCYGTTADQLKTDDRAALSRLYPVTAANLVTGKQLFFENAFRIHGSVRFIDANGRPAQPMQGVNVVAHWFDPTARATSGTFVASSVSGFLFRGNAGNSVTGFTDSVGNHFDQFGSDDVNLEGFYDLSGLEIGDRGLAEEFQISVEPLDPTWSADVGPYGHAQVWPSGSSNLLVARPTRGKDLVLDIVMQSSAPQVADRFGPQTFVAPAQIPAGGDWVGSISGYGTTDYFRLPGKANRTLAIEVTSLNEKGSVSQSKAMPAIGIWALRDTQIPAQEFSPFAFNTGEFGFTRLDQITLQENTDFRIGIADFRGDGRPDFRYHARVLYGDRVIPARASVAGGTVLTVQGLGFRPTTAVQVGGATMPTLGISANALLANAPAELDGIEDIALVDPDTGSSSVMTGALTFGAGPNDQILPVSVTNPPVVVGADAPSPIRVRVVAADGVTPISGASVAFQSNPPASLSACGGAGNCTVLTDQNGLASTRAALKTRAAVTLSAQLAPRSYSPPKQVLATLAPNASIPLDIVLAPETVWVAQGGAIDLSMTAIALASGDPQLKRTLNFLITKGSPTLSASSGVTDSAGRASVNIHLPAVTEEVHLVACVAPANLPCSRTFRIIPVASSALRLQPVSGNLQFTFGSQPLQPVVVRVTDASVPPNPVTGADVIFQALLTQPQNNPAPVSIGDTNITHNPAPGVLGSYHLTSTSDGDGLATFHLPPSNFPDIEIMGTAFAGIATLQLQLRVLPNMPVQVTPARAKSFTETAATLTQQKKASTTEDAKIRKGNRKNLR
ncbi:MAG TPA: IPT/TIG domain-containing protein [Terriglobales bacterium]|nr:IPT/TIG domain-containing protein [Terriglobales bacterium]